MEKYLLVSFILIFFANATTLDANSSSIPIYDSIFKCFQQHKIPISQISTILFSPTNPFFTNVLQSTIRNRRFDTTATPKPSAIITPAADSHVSAAVVCAKEIRVQLKIRSGGHDFEGTSYVSDQTFVILDMSNFRAIDVSLDDRTVWVESAAFLGELYYRIWEKSNELAFPGGVCPTMGVGGHITGAGYGNLIRKYGVSVDHVIDARVVDASGRVLDRESMGEDLFWAIRGGGAASFCVVLGFKIKLVPVPPSVTVFEVQKVSNDAIEAFYKYQQLVENIDRDLFIRIVVSPITANNSRVISRATFQGMFLGNASRVLSILNSQFPELGLRNSDCHQMRWIDSVLEWTGLKGFTTPTTLLSRNYSASFFKRKSDYVKTLIPKSGLESMFKKVEELQQVSLVFNSYGGIMSEIPESATAFPHRGGNIFKIQYTVSWGSKGGEGAIRDYLGRIREMYGFMTPFVSKNPRGAFLNYRDLDIGVVSGDNSGNMYEQGKVYGLKYFKGNLDRLVKIKTEVDPENLFRNEQSIPILPSQGESAKCQNDEQP